MRISEGSSMVSGTVYFAGDEVHFWLLLASALKPCLRKHIIAASSDGFGAVSHLVQAPEKQKCWGPAMQ